MTYAALISIVLTTLPSAIICQTPNEAKPLPGWKSVEERKQMSERERSNYLQKLGHVPDDADLKDYELAQNASWWGKPIDPKHFWKNRMIWLDDSALRTAQSRGRRYPPMPFEDPEIPKYPNEDKDWDGSQSGSVEGLNIRFHAAPREGRFWDRFVRTHPKPPDDLHRYQLQIAERILQEKRDFEVRGNIMKKTAQSVQNIVESIRHSESELHYPPEALRDDALFWVYVLAKKAEYHKALRQGTLPKLAQNKEAYFSSLAVDSKFITQPLTQEQINESLKWKIDYLRRLRSEKIDESYIRAYIEAWNLSRELVFLDERKP